MPNRALRGDGAASSSNGFNAFRQSLHLHPHQQTIPSSIPPELLQKKVMKSPSLSEKIAFFDQLDALDNVSDGDDEVDEKEQDHRNKCRAFFSSRKRNNPGPVQETQEKEKPRAPSHQRRTASMPTPAGVTPGSRVIEGTPAAHNMKTRQAAGLGEFLPNNTTSFVEETPVPDTTRPLPATLRRSATLPPPSSSSTMEQSPSASTALRKRKRQSSTKSIPEAAQMFRGLSFYYIPNNDIAPARKLRIGKAQEYGARWVRNLEDASHTIVDKYLEYKDIKSVLGSEAPNSLVIVNEDYPIDCISFRTLLNLDQNRYRVAGCPGNKHQLASDKAPSSPSRSSDHSLQVKPPQTSRRRGSADKPPENDPASPHSDAQITRGVSENQTLGGITGNPSEAHAGQVRPAIRDNGSLENAPPPPGRTSNTNDELSECIELLQQYKDLPLDAEDDDLQSVKDDHEEADSDSEIDDRSEDERARKRTAQTRRKGPKNIPFEERFACNRGGTKDQTTDTNNPNAKTIEILQSMCDYYTRTNDTWRIMAYRKAITTLRRQPTKITTAAAASLLPNIGPRLAAKIQEIATTNRLRRLDYTHDSPLDQALALFLGVYGAGAARAHRWMAQGHRSLADLLSSADLTPHQRLGVERYADLNARIPRAEVGAFFAYVQREAAGVDPGVEVLVGGSYRRGADSSGDVDVIVTRKGTVSAAELVPFLEELVEVLTRKGFLVATLAALHANRAGKDGPGSKWHGCCVLPPDEEGADTNTDANPDGGSGGGSGGPRKEPIWRRIDFLLVPEAEYGAALIYFTGNDIFNRSLRLLASKKGMRLNQRGLYKEVLRGKNRAKITEDQLLEGRDEKRIFELLGVKWREPWERWC
ncbi:hypothetical protein F5144DRAFT_636791 [Chaetomium tenue]|uniref:Uncharacterized protein n=1 Tax=Chaetomium tenue TaxID=1854479 RepID=A0ACB7PSE7_9PEZI|nr:hypothetical protein F5144DRAFT_636791 [Chaetomium globosum]